MYSYLTTASLLAFCFASTSVRGQGCSDAGACTVGAMNVAQHTTDSVRRHSVKAVGTYGLGENASHIGTLQLEVNLGLTSILSVQVRGGGQVVNSSLGTTLGVTDASVGLTARLFSTASGHRLYSTLAVRLPTGKANLTDDLDRPLPMYHQTTLGTLDGILGFKYGYRWFNVAIAYQQPFTQNGNRYFGISAYPDSVPIVIIPPDEYYDFPTTNRFERGPDLVLRLYPTLRVKKAVLEPGILAIYHPFPDHATNASGQRVELVGSAGLTLNAFVGMTYPLNDRLQLESTLAFVLLARDSRPDGLTRAATFSVGLGYGF